MLVFKAKPRERRGWKKREVEWVQTASPFPLPAMSSALWGHADRHRELRSPSMLSAPPDTGMSPSLHLKVQVSP